MELKNIEVIDDPEGEEVDIQFLKSSVEFVPNDPFLEVDIRKVHGRKLRRKGATLQKADGPFMPGQVQGFTGQDGTRAKYDEYLVNGYTLFEVVEPPYNIANLASLYDEHAIHRACIDARVMNTVGLGNSWEQTLKARRKTEKTAGKLQQRNRWRDQLDKESEQLNILMDSFNNQDSFQDILIKIWIDVLSTGNGYMEIGRTTAGKIGYVGHIPAKYVRVRKARDGYVQFAMTHRAIFFRNFGDLEKDDPFGNDDNPNEILHFKVYSPTNNFYGVPPAVAAAPAILGDKYAKQFNIDYFENKAIPRYAIIVKGVKLSEKSKRELVNYFRNEVKGKNHGTLIIPLPTITGSGKDTEIKFEKLEADVTDMSFDKYRKANRDEIISAYRVPPTKISVYENANLAISRDADKTFKTQVVGPDQVLITKKLNKIIAEFSENLMWKFNELDLVDEDIKSRIYDRYLRTQVFTPNDVREKIGEAPREDGDEPLTWPADTKLIADEKAREAMDNSQGSQGTDAGSGRFGNQNANSGGPTDNQSPAGGDRNERGQSQDSGDGADITADS